MSYIVTGKAGDRHYMLGNEAAVRGALEAGVAVAATYPGTPSSEIGNTFHKIAKEAGVYFEFSSNEKVALEVAGSAAVAGVRAMAFMKHVGLNVASDAFMTLGYTGVRGGLVIISADDPGCHSSQNEQDNRYYAAKLSKIPMLEPSIPQEFKEMVRDGFDISEKFEMPVMVRTTTRVNHIRGTVEFSDRREIKNKVEFKKDPFRFVVVPQVARKRHPWQLHQLGLVEEFAEECRFNQDMDIDARADGKDPLNGKKVGFVTSGASFGYVKEAIVKLGIRARVFKLGLTNPIPENKLAAFMKDVDHVIVVEEGEPYLEEDLKVLAFDRHIDVKISGKGDGVLSRVGEYNPDVVTQGTASALNLDYEVPETPTYDEELPSRPPVMCPGCPHRATYYAIKKTAKPDALFGTDIGCYTLGVQPPYEMADLLLCMGSSISSASGFAKVTDNQVFSVIGDSTFFHTGIPALVNAVHNNHKFVLVVVDNSTTAMTGHQPHPGLPIDGMGDIAAAIDIEKVVRAIGVKFVRKVDPYNLEETQTAFKEALEYDGLSVIISKQRCALLIDRDKRRTPEGIVPYQVNQDQCKKCLVCVSQFACPALQLTKDGGINVISINEALCDGCGVCAQVCPFDAIHSTKPEVEDE